MSVEAGIPLEERASRIGSSLAQAVASECDAVELVSCSAFDGGNWQSLELPVSLPGRSVEFTYSDLGAALSGASYNSAANSSWLVNELAAVQSRQLADVSRVGRMSDAIQGRFGEESFSADTTRYLVGVCPYVSFSSVDIEPSVDPIAFFNLRLHSVCDGVSQGLELAGTSSRNPACILHADGDPIGIDVDQAQLEWSEATHVISQGPHGLSIDNVDLQMALASSVEGNFRCR